MRIYLLRHADAEPIRATDAERELTPQGFAQARTVGGFCRSRGIKPALILASPYRRTIQTAELVAEAIEGSDGVQAEHFLTSGMEPDKAFAELQAYGWAESLMLVGHQPDLGLLAGALLGLEDAGGMPVSKATLIGIDVNRLVPYGGRLRFLVPVELMGD